MTSQGRKWTSTVDNSRRMVAQRRQLQTLRAGTSAAAFTLAPPEPHAGVVQREVIVGKDSYTRPTSKDTDALIEDLRAHDDSDLWKRGWIGQIREMARGSGVSDFTDFDELIAFMNDTFAKVDTDDEEEWAVRPNFSKLTYDLARATSSIDQNEDMSSIGLQENDLAVPHRMPFADLRMNLKRFIDGGDSSDDLIRWTDRLLLASRERMALNEERDEEGWLPAKYKKLVEQQMEEFESRRSSVVKLYSTGDRSLTSGRSAALKKFSTSLNGLHGNVPDIGPHSTVNIRVSDRVHPNFRSNGLATPGTKAALAMTPNRFSKGFATTIDGRYLVTTAGERIPIDILGKTSHRFSKTKISSRDLKPKKLSFDESDSDSDSDSDFD